MAEIDIDLKTVKERERTFALLGERSNDVFSRGVEGLIPFERMIGTFSRDIDNCQYGMIPEEIEIYVQTLIDGVRKLCKHFRYEQELQTQVQWLYLLENQRDHLMKQNVIKWQVWKRTEKYADETKDGFERDCQRAAYFLTGAYCESRCV
jgi:hypothetical protein